jgi:hypothetical protein
MEPAMAYDDEEYDDEMLDEEIDGIEETDEGENRELVAGISGWGISLVAHGLIAFVLMYIYIMGQLKPERPPVRLTQIDPPPPPEEQKPPEERSLEDVEVTVVAEEISENPQVTDLDLPVEETETEDDVIAEVEAPKGREEAVSDAEAGGTAAFMAIGAGGGAKGAFGNRRGGGKKRAVGANGGNRRSESAVEAALRWFKRHQSPDGSWDVDGYPDNCTDRPKCEPGTAHTDLQGDVACTGYALLCFLGAGYDHVTPNKYRKVVADGLDWLQKLAGPGDIAGVKFGGQRRMYHNAIASMAVVEAYAMTQDSAIKKFAQDCVDFVVAEQNIDPRDEGGYRLGWNYAPSKNRNDSSVSGWACMALKSAAAGGLDVGSSMEGAKKYLKDAWEDVNAAKLPTLGSDGETTFPYAWNPADGKGEGGGTTCVGALMAVFLGHKQGDLMLETMLNYIMKKQFPTGYPTNAYYMYYNTLSVFQAGGARWNTWNDKVRDMLIEAQRPAGDGCFDGSWDWQNSGGHTQDVGRLLSTAYCCLSLEVYYRYVRVNH